MEQLEATNEELEDSNNQLKEANEELEDANTRLEETNEELEGNITRLEEGNEQLEEEITQLETSKEEIIEEKLEVEEQVTELEGRLEQLIPFEGLEGEEWEPSFSESFADKVNQEWGTRLQYRYRRVKVLLVQWFHDDLGVAPEMDLLAKIFRNLYRYEVSKFCIPDEQPSTALNARIINFIGDHAADALLIFYYGGHGMIDPVTNATYWQS